MIMWRFYKLFRFLIVRVRTSGRRHLGGRGPFIVVSNHLGSFGPITVMSSVPVRLHPWVAHDVTELARAAERIRREFVEGELHLRPPLSRWLSAAVARLCVALMRDIGAVPVYDRSRRIRGTVEASTRLLERGRNILVFPEDPVTPARDGLGDLRTGFMRVAKLYYERTRRAVAFLPVAVNRSVRALKIGAPVRFDGSIPFRQERVRLKSELESSISRMYRELELGGRPARLARTATG